MRKSLKQKYQAKVQEDEVLHDISKQKLHNNELIKNNQMIIDKMQSLIGHNNDNVFDCVSEIYQQEDLNN